MISTHNSVVVKINAIMHDMLKYSMVEIVKPSITQLLPELSVL